MNSYECNSPGSSIDQFQTSLLHCFLTVNRDWWSDNCFNKTDWSTFSRLPIIVRKITAIIYVRSWLKIFQIHLVIQPWSISCCEWIFHRHFSLHRQSLYLFWWFACLDWNCWSWSAHFLFVSLSLVLIHSAKSLWVSLWFSIQLP